MTDLIKVMSTLVEPGTGKILVEGIMDDVAPGAAHNGTRTKWGESAALGLIPALFTEPLVG
jgi:hypothetical protein